MDCRFGLCCIFSEQPIKFRRTTATHLMKMNRQEQLEKLSGIIFDNAKALLKSLEFCTRSHIGAFRINSQLIPLKTHPDVAYKLEQLPDAALIFNTFRQCRDFALAKNIRLSFHPDQFIHLSSDKKQVTENSIRELEHQNEMADLTGADVINIHGGGAFGDKPSALGRIREHLKYLSGGLRGKLTIENDDRVYSPEDLLPLCMSENIPLVYDIHHHRCLPDGLTEEEATVYALKTWNREPLFHVSSPINGWGGDKQRSHHDFLNPEDFPEFWKNLRITVDIEAKLKEVAVIKLMNDLKS